MKPPPLTLTCEIITPLFPASAIPGDCELRPAAIKGALRFWWRALNAHMDEDTMRLKEAQLFGAPDEKIGRSRVRLTISDAPQAILPSFNGKGRTYNVPG